MANPKITPPGISSVELLGLLNSVKNRGLTHPNLVIGTGSAAKVKFTNDTDVCVNGKTFRIAAAVEVAFTPTTDDIAASAGVIREAVYLVVVDEAGTPTLYKGTEASGAGSADVPATPEGYACVGYLRLAVAAGATNFDASSDLLSAGHLTDTYVNLSVNPADWGVQV